MQQALQQAEALSEATKVAQAAAADVDRQKALLNDTMDQLKQAGVLVSAPAGVALVSGSDLQLSASRNLIATAGSHADVSVLKRFTVAAGELVSVFAQKLGIKLFAAKGKVDIQAQGDAMALSALKDLTITSTDGKLILSAAKEVWIGANGSYICINGNGIENGTPGDIVEKCAHWGKQGPQCQSQAANQWIGTAFNERFRAQLPNGEVARNRPYIVTRADGGEIHGVTDANGMIALQQGVQVEGLNIKFQGSTQGGSAA
jgi:type VI secretion system secreted protein VgrG